MFNFVEAKTFLVFDGLKCHISAGEKSNFAYESFALCQSNFCYDYRDESQNPLFMDENIASNVRNFENVEMYTKGGASKKLRKNYNLQCNFCKIKGHIKDHSWKLIGYSTNHKVKKRNTEGTNGACSVMTDSNECSSLRSQYGMDISVGSDNTKFVVISVNAKGNANVYYNTQFAGNSFCAQLGNIFT